MIVVPTIPAHLYGFDLQEEQLFVSEIMDETYIDCLTRGIAFTGLTGFTPVVCAGVIPLSDTCGSAWALLSKDAKDHLVGITKSIKDFLEKTGFDRIQTAVKHDFKEGHRWAKMLGFKNETPDGMEKYGLHGETCDLYSRIK